MSYGRYDEVEKRQEGGKECLAQFTYGKVARERGKTKHMIRIRQRRNRERFPYMRLLQFFLASSHLNSVTGHFKYRFPSKLFDGRTIVPDFDELDMLVGLARTAV